MDLLDSILGSMEKPPTVKKPEIKDKAQREKMEKLQKQRQEAERRQKQMIDKFRADIIRKVGDFVNTPTTDIQETREWILKPMSQIERTIVREACEEHEDEIVVHSFGTDEVDRHCIIWKKGCEPCEEELRAMKLGVEYKPKNEEEEDEQEDEAGEERPGTVEGKDKYWCKYEKVIGENAHGLGSARVAEPAKQYGCVPIDNKKDQRSIEQMMDDIRRSKRQKTEEQVTSSTSQVDQSVAKTSDSQRSRKSQQEVSDESLEPSSSGAGE